ncbi:uncharacterized protein EI90DRAFT_3151841 [Cantharellus anzutake]|uniref:uncharacterized protein n=1 Tax=Cantharellus anzutake TaxID=1750568 RepID=UPI001907A59D|nr:uncharacterized protein EI90DRAFT_3151841 [Cantharellus anzutake]KAF8338013.1 hypothetical protein EI90DRAFT_3151841 [Cantharellus anzutake]
MVHIPGVLEGFLGGIFVGTVVSTFLFGILTVQTLLYYKRFPQDSKWTRLAIGLLWVAFAFQAAFMTKAMWWWLIRNPAALGRAIWEFSSYSVATAVASLVVQSFFVSRIWSFSSNSYIAAPMQALVFIQFAFSITVSTVGDIVLNFPKFAQKWTWTATVWLALQATADVTIAVLMTHLLWRRKTGFKGTDGAIETMVYWAIATGGVTCLQSLLVLGIFTVHGFTFWALVFAITLGPMYPISMLTNLHMRSRVRKQLSEFTGPNIPLDELRSAQKKPVTVTPCQRDEPKALTNSAKGSIMVNVHRSEYEDSLSNINVHRLGRDKIHLSDANASRTFRSNVKPETSTACKLVKSKFKT